MYTGKNLDEAPTLPRKGKAPPGIAFTYAWAQM